MKDVYDNVIDCVGRTPIVRLNKIGKDLGHEFYVKLEFLNPGNSIKDRIAIQMIKDAEASGELMPGGTIIETTSGNTGMGLAMVGAVKGYKCIFVMPDKISDEKVKALRAFGARVISTPTAVEPDDPRSYYSVARRLAEEIPNSFYVNQYDNPSNPQAHYLSTGPEIWEQMGEELDFLVAGAGTGGTISGCGRFLKEKNPKAKMIGVDPIGSIFYEYFKTGKAPKLLTTYKVEGFGEDFIPSTIHFDYIDDVVQVTDKECFQMARELVKKEGIFAGGSCGGAVTAALKYAEGLKEKGKKFLILLPDSGSRYLSKIYDDDWMRENGFLEPAEVGKTLKEVLGDRYGKVFTAERKDPCSEVIHRMKADSFSQMPVVDQGKIVGIITEVDLLNALLEGRATEGKPVEKFMETDVKTFSPDSLVSELTPVFKEGYVGIVTENEKPVGVLTKIDVVEYLSSHVEKQNEQ